MSPASYLTAPPRDAAFILAPSVRPVATVSFAVMVFWSALAILLVGVVGGTVFIVIRGFQLWRNAREVGRTIGVEMDRISAVTRQIEQHTARAEAAAARLQDAGGRLAVSRARLDVQLAAVREAREQMRRVFWFVPGI